MTGILGSGRMIKKAVSRALRGGHQFISWNHTDMTPAMVKQVHASGLSLNVWTVNHSKDMKRMIDLSVDSISSDDTIKLKRIADENGIIQIRPICSDLSPDHK